MLCESFYCLYGNEDESIDVDITFYHSHDPDFPILILNFTHNIEQMTFSKNEGAPHQRKNCNIAVEGEIKH